MLALIAATCLQTPNGYLDYVKAAELVSTDAFTQINSPEAQQAGPRYTLAKKVLERYGIAIDWIRAGNLKNVYEPRTEIGWSTTFPELQHFKSLSKLMADQAFVRFADGNPAGGMESLITGIKFGRNIQTSTLINMLVGVACVSIQMAELEKHLCAIPLSDCRKLFAYCDSALKEPPAFVKAMDAEWGGMVRAINGVVAGDAKTLDMIDNEAHDIAAWSKQASQSDKTAVRYEVLGAAAEHMQWLHDVASKLEGEWPSEPERNTSTIATLILGVIMPNKEQMLIADIRTRTQLRLARLAAKVMEYRWLRDQLPPSLKDLELPGTTIDPLSKDYFAYEVTGVMTFTLYSKGNDKTGAIYLKARPKVEW